MMRCNYELQHMTLRVTVESAGASLRPSNQSIQRDRWLERGCPILSLHRVCSRLSGSQSFDRTLQYSDTECTLAIWA